MDGVQRFKKPEVEVEALQFKGLANLHEVLTWLDGIIYISPGRESAYRTVDEYGEDGLLLPSAAGFGIIQTQSGYDRVNVDDWIVKYDADHISVYEPMDFSYKFEAVSV